MLADAFSQFGQLTEGLVYLRFKSQPLLPLQYFLISNSFLFAATIIMDIGKNRSKGYGYVTSSTEEEAQKALVDMNGKVKLHHFSLIYHAYIVEFKHLTVCTCSYWMDELFLWIM